MLRLKHLWLFLRFGKKTNQHEKYPPQTPYQTCWVSLGSLYVEKKSELSCWVDGVSVIGAGGRGGPVKWWFGKTGGCGWLVDCGGCKVAWWRHGGWSCGSVSSWWCAASGSLLVVSFVGGNGSRWWEVVLYHWFWRIPHLVGRRLGFGTGGRKSLLAGVVFDVVKRLKTQWAVVVVVPVVWFGLSSLCSGVLWSLWLLFFGFHSG